MNDHSPLLILSPHRSGSSAVTRLIAEMGLHLGEVLPPRHDNPYGYFESIHINNENRYMLRSMDRDWTCPPPQLSDKVVHEQRLETAVLRTLDGFQGPWGFKDPRTLFTLGAWASVFPEVRLLGVYRSTEAISRSLQRRDGFTASEADSIALRYNERLADLHQLIEFPILGFGVEGSDLVSRVQAIASLVGLDAEKEVGALLDESIIHHRGTAQNSVDEYLAAASTRPIPRDFAFARNELVKALANLPHREEVASRRLGPSFQARRDLALSDALTFQPLVGQFLDISPTATSPAVPSGVASDLFHWIDPMEISEAADLGAGMFNHVVGVDALEAIPAGSLEAILSKIGDLTAPNAVLVLSGTVLDIDHVTEAFFDDRRMVSFREGVAPYLHHRVDLERALSRTPWYMLSVEAGGDFRVTLSKSVVAQSVPSIAMSGSRLRAEHEIALTRLTDLAEVQTQLGARDAELAAETQKLEEIEALASSVKTHNEHLQDTVGDLTVRLGEVVDERDQLRIQHGKTRARVKGLVSREAKLAKELAALNKKYARLLNRRSVRLALWGAQKLRFVRRVPGVSTAYRTTKGRQLPMSKPVLIRRVNGPEVIRALTRLRPALPLADAGLVSIIVPTRDGLHHMQRLVDGLRLRTDYPTWELIVVDNASSDGSADWASNLNDIDVKVIRNSRNESFSRACNQGAEVATGKFLLFLNNDVDPINPSWLSAMVDSALRNDDAGAVGALLVYPEFGDDSGSEFGFTVQHRGIAYTWHKNRPRAVNLGRGEDPTTPVLSETFRVPSVTAACMLIPTAVFHEIDKFDEAYVYGTEDVDLNLKIRQSGRSVYFCGQAALFHHESASQDELGAGVVRVNRMTNAQVFVDRWAPSLSRTLHLDGLRESPQWRDPLNNNRKVAVTLTRDDPGLGWGDWYTAHELGDAFASAGWEVVYAERYENRWHEIPEDVGLVISLLDGFDVRTAPASAVTVAWIRNWTDRWLDQPWIGAYDVLVPSSEGSSKLIEERLGRTADVIPLASNPDRFHPGPVNPTYASDFVFTGNFWGQGREIIDQLIVDHDERFLIFGKNWDKVPRVQRFWRGFLDYELLPEVYRSAAITIDDTAGPTLPYGAINSRVFDALASGSLVLTDNQKGSDETFGGLLPTYSTREELRGLLDKFLTDEPARAALVERLRSMVLESHTYAKRVDDFLFAVDTELRRPRVAIKIGAPDWDVAETWGDTHFARHFAAALRRRSFHADIHVLAEWDAEGHQDADIVVHIRGLTPYVPKPTQINVLWIISHPEDINPREVERYDLVLVASSKFAAHLAGLVDVPVVVFHQATDIDHFYPRPSDPELQAGVLFVGNSRKTNRPAVSYLRELGVDFDLYGNDWDEIVPPEYLRGFMPNEDLPVLYSSCDILINDHWTDMREWGFISNRLFDALAAGAFVVSDDVDGLAEAFDGAVPTFDSAASLGALISQFRNDPQARQAQVAKGLSIVRDRHTFDARATEFAKLIAPLLSDHRFEVVPR